MPPLAKSKIKRVLINKRGIALTPKEAARKGIKADVVFIRNDGYELGAPQRLREEARQMWLKDWEKFYDAHEKIKRPISDYYSHFSKKRN